MIKKIAKNNKYPLAITIRIGVEVAALCGVLRGLRYRPLTANDAKIAKRRLIAACDNTDLKGIGNISLNLRPAR